MPNIDVGKVAMVKLSDIIVDDRARHEYGDLSELEESIKKEGLIQPLAVKLVNNKYRLLAGERRFIVLERSKVYEVPVRIYEKDLNEMEMKSIELSENFYRKDFEYWEQDALIANIQSIKQKIHGVKTRGPGDKGWGNQDTAKLVGVSDMSVSLALKRANAREQFPELFEKCKTQKDAIKLMSKMEETIVKEQIANKIKKQNKDSQLHQLSKCFIVKDFFEGIKEVPDSIMHLVEIDPPYAIDLNKAKKKDSESCYIEDNYNEIDKNDYQVFLAKLFSECYRVMTDHSWLLCWFAPEPWFEIVFQELNNAGFSTTRMCGIWNKPSGQSKRPEVRLANAYEMFFYAWKGTPVLNKQGRKNSFDFTPVPPQQKVHPTERPLDLMKEIYNTFAFPGSRVLIPFLGSGVGILAAHELGMSPIGFELTKAYKDSFLVKSHKILN